MSDGYKHTSSSFGSEDARAAARVLGEMRARKASGVVGKMEFTVTAAGVLGKSAGCNVRKQDSGSA